MASRKAPTFIWIILKRLYRGDTMSTELVVLVTALSGVLGYLASRHAVVDRVLDALCKVCESRKVTEEEDEETEETVEEATEETQ